jgi:hypothetical protein
VWTYWSFIKIYINANVICSNMIFISRNMIFVLCDHVFWFLPIVQSN